MRIRNVAIKGFKSIDEITISVSGMNIFVGKNNAGKSNILDALRFLRDSKDKSMEGLYQLWDGFDSISFGKEAIRNVTINITLTLEENRGPILKDLFRGNAIISVDDVMKSGFLKTLTYSLTFGNQSWQERLDTYDVIDGQLTLVETTSEDLHAYNTKTTQLKNICSSLHPGKNIIEFPVGTRNASGRDKPLIFRYLDNQRSIDDTIKNLASSIREKLTDRLLWLNPLRGSIDVIKTTGTEELNEDGSNIVDVLHTLYNKDSPKYHEILYWISEIIPSIRKVITPPVMEETDVGIRESDYPDDITFLSENLSLGLKNMLILLCKVITSPERSILLIEEPEIHLHPGSQRKLFSFFKEHSQDRQIWITTHSPVFVGQASPEDVKLVKRDKGRTQVITLDEDNIQLVLGELEIFPSDFLEADILVFVEGDSDEKIFGSFYSTLVRENEIQESNIRFLGCGGWGSIKYFANARILETRKIQIIVHAIFDGGIKRERKEVLERAIEDLKLDEDHYTVLDRNSIEDYLLIPRAIKEAFPQLNFSRTEIEDFLKKSQGKRNKKQVLKSLFKENELSYHEEDGEKVGRAMKREEIDQELIDIMKNIVSKLND